jgi:hypothetical protein
MSIHVQCVFWVVHLASYEILGERYYLNKKLILQNTLGFPDLKTTKKPTSIEVGLW